MLPVGDFADMNYLGFENPTMFHENCNMMQSNLQTLGGYINILPSYQMLPALHEMNPQQSSSISNNSTSDEAEEQKYNVIDERKQRRMISNRESARRSRMRKQKHLDELWSLVIRLRTENHALLDKFNHMFESHNQVVQENVKLKDEVSQLRGMVTNLQITGPDNFLKDLEEIPCNMDNVREASRTQSTSSSEDLLN